MVNMFITYLLIVIYIIIGIVYSVVGPTSESLFVHYKFLKIKNNWYKIITYWDIMMIIIFLPISLFILILSGISFLFRTLYNILNKNVYN